MGDKTLGDEVKIGGRDAAAATTISGLSSRRNRMAKGYWIAFYRSVSDPNALAEYAKLAGPAIQAGGGKFIARGGTAKTFEAGIDQRVVVIEFESVERAVSTYQGEAYQAALKLLKGTADRDIRIVEGVA
jgi:uncharacterized protein (DUF1330 family)